jgi:hypothetical protein
VHLHGPKPPPTWLADLELPVRFKYHNNVPLFGNEQERPGLGGLIIDLINGEPLQTEPANDSWVIVNLRGPNPWPLAVSTPERAILEVLDELPRRESFHQVDMLMDCAASLRPKSLQRLLAECRSVKVKRLFFFFADRHRHRWLDQVDKSKVDLGQGKRSLIKGGKLDPTYQITVPADLHPVL